jgi:cell division protein ZapB
MDTPDVIEQLRSLASRFDELAARSQRLAEENRSLRQQHEQLSGERSQLLAKNEQARSRVEAMIARLKSLGLNWLFVPTFAEVAGDPEIRGAESLPATVIEKGPIRLLASPSETVTTMPSCTPVSLFPGAPNRRPVTRSNFNQAGLPATLNVSVSPSRSLTMG